MPLHISLNNISHTYIIILIASLIGGLFFADYTIHLAPHITLFLAIIFFLTALKINVTDILKNLENKKLLFFINLSMLIIFPIIVYYITLLIYPPLAIAFLILAAMPSGMAAPLLAEVAGGKQSLALVLTITTSLLAPFTIPIVIKLLAGTAVSVSFLSMMWSLSKVIFIPFALAHLVRHFFPNMVKKSFRAINPLSLILLGLLFMGVIARQSANFTTELDLRILHYIIALFILFILFHIIGYVSMLWQKKDIRIATTVSLTYMNFTIAIYLAGQFFNEPHIVIPIVLTVLPWSMMILPFKYVSQKLS